MKNIFFLLIIISSNIFYGQSLNDLDIKNGFRHFKFGSTPSQIKNIVKQTNQSSQNPKVVSYEYIGEDITNIFNVKVDNIYLSFFNNKLFSVGVNFGNMENVKNFEIYEFNNILTALENTYGTKWVAPSNKDGVVLNGAIWDANNVRLELVRIDFSKSYTNPKDYGYISGYINVFDKKLMNAIHSSNF
ncbi:hypothetical protein [Epilithonimonas vandammei]|uniref:Uncharacterized protein n=1 Tax=Epilithonimonas vandammei TaxID=2487072 RepID=A0A3G8YC94_9FLAO|nr:hypothetical protein [Epilithonimonas vandammei]AZI40074.1 hypothetical protein EIB74_08920 [Epilithonimonas vandammei]